MDGGGDDEHLREPREKGDGEGEGEGRREGERTRVIVSREIEREGREKGRG